MADATVHLEIVTPDGLKLATDVSEFTAPSIDGEFGVLPGHVPLLAALATGIVSYVANGEKHLVAVGAGFAEVVEDKAVLITDHFMTKAEVDPVIARLALKEADEALDKFAGDLHGAEHGVLVARELWAAAQLELYGDPPPPRMRTLDELSFGGVENYSALEPEQASTQDGGEQRGAGDDAKH